MTDIYVKSGPVTNFRDSEDNDPHSFERISIQEALANVHGDDIIHLAPGIYPIYKAYGAKSGVYFLDNLIKNGNSLTFIGESQDPNDVIIESGFGTQYVDLNLKNLTIRPLNPNKTLQKAAILLNGNNTLTLENVKVKSNLNEKYPAILLTNTDSELKLINSKIDKGAMDYNSVAFMGKATFYDSNISSGLYLAKKENMVARDSKFSWIELHDDSKFNAYNCHFLRDQINMHENSRFISTNSTFHLSTGLIIKATGYNNLINLYSSTLTGTLVSPKISVINRNNLHFSVNNTDEFFRSHPIQVFSNDKEYKNPNSNLPSTVSNTGNTINIHSPQDFRRGLYSAKKSDTIVLDKGKYTFDLPYDTLSNITFRGATGDPKDVILQFSKSVTPYKNSFLNLQDITIEKNPNNSDEFPLLQSVNENAELNIKNCIVKYDREKSPAIFVYGEGSCTIQHTIMESIGELKSEHILVSDHGKVTVMDSKLAVVATAKFGEIELSKCELTNISATGNSIIHVNDSKMQSNMFALDSSKIMCSGTEFVGYSTYDCPLFGADKSGQIELHGGSLQVKPIFIDLMDSSHLIIDRVKFNPNEPLYAKHKLNSGQLIKPEGLKVIIGTKPQSVGQNDKTNNKENNVGLSIDVNSNEMFRTALHRYQAGDSIVLEKGKYTIDSQITAFQNLTIKGNGDKPDDVVINLKATIGPLANKYLNLENLTLQKASEVETQDDSNPFELLSLQFDSSEINLNHCIVKFNDEKSSAIVAAKASKCTIEQSTFINNAENSCDLLSADSANIVAKNSIFNTVIAQGKGKIQLQHSTVDIIMNHEESNVIAENCIIRKGGAAGENAVLVLNDCRFDYIDDQALMFAARQSAQVSVNGGEIPNESHKILIEIKDNGKLILKLSKYNADYPIYASMPFNSAQISKPQDLKILVLNETLENQDSDVNPKSATETAGPILSEEERTTIANTAYQELQDMIGLKKVKTQIEAFISQVKFMKAREEHGKKTSNQTLHSFFLGNPGTGKTVVARLLGKILYGYGVLEKPDVIDVSRADLVSPYVGKTATQTKTVMQRAQGGILLIDEAYSLYQTDGGSNPGQEAVDEIIKFMEDNRRNLMIIFTGYPKQMQDFINMNPGLSSRVPNTFNFEDYTSDEIVQIGESMLEEDGYKLDNEKKFSQLVKEAYSMTNKPSNGRWIRNYKDKLIRQLAMDYSEGKTTSLDTISDSQLDEVFEVATDKVNDRKKDLDKQMKKLNEMVGLAGVKAEVKQLVDKIKVARALEDTTEGKTVYHMIFTGDPGTGKTTVARILANMFYDLRIMPKKTVIETYRSKMIGQYVGETEKKVEKIVRDAMGGVLFVDEAYQLTQEDNKNDFGKNAVETLVKLLSDYDTKFVAIFAGYDKEMEEFLDANPGLRRRIPITIHFEPYTPEEVAEIARRSLKSKKYEFNEDLLNQIIVKKYSSLPQKEKSNGGWAKNFVEKLIVQHTSYLSHILDEQGTEEVKRQRYQITDATLESMKEIKI